MARKAGLAGALVGLPGENPVLEPVRSTEGEELADYLVYRPKPPRKRPFRIFRTDRGYKVTGPEAEELDDEALREALRLAGAKPGETVLIGERTYTFQ